MNFQKKIVIGLRDSELSKAQTREFMSLAEKNIEEINENNFELKYVKTSGDIHHNERLDKIGGKGLFIKEIEERILNGEVDIGIHSMKDIPAQNHQELEIFCFMKRLDNSDVLISNSGKSFADLDSGSIIGTSSIRRRSQILHFRKDLNIKLLRGNVDTRIRKLRNKEFDAIILSKAGIERLKLQHIITETLDQEKFLPAGCQGAVGIQASKKNSKFKKIFSLINDINTEIECSAEREVLRTIQANCNSPVSIYAKLYDDQLKINFELFDHDGTTLFKKNVSGHKNNFKIISQRLGEEVINEVGKNKIEKLDKLKNDFNYTP